MATDGNIDPAATTAGGCVNRVLIAGGGIAALELLLALHVLAGSRVSITLLSAQAEFAPPAMTVAEPFERGGAQRYAWSQIAEQQGAQLVIDSLVAVDTAARVAATNDGRRLGYDILAITTGARRVQRLRGARLGQHAAVRREARTALRGGIRIRQERRRGAAATRHRRRGPRPRRHHRLHPAVAVDLAASAVRAGAADGRRVA